MKVAEFVENYQPEYFNYLRVNPTEDSRQYDLNGKRRDQISAYVHKNLKNTPTQLIRDLFLANSESAVHHHKEDYLIAVLAKELLCRQGTKALPIYIRGLQCGIEAYLSGIELELTAELKQQLQDECRRRILCEVEPETLKQYQTLLDCLQHTLN